jgi:phenylacetate-CoA ligase
VTSFPDRASLERHQQALLARLAEVVDAGNRFYRAKLSGIPLADSARDLALFRTRVPFTTKDELQRDQQSHPPYGSNLSFPLPQYVRCHQTSGSSGTPIRWLDTPESWAWMLGNWRRVLEAAGIAPGDRIYFAFSFGPFLGFWTAFEAATQLGCLVLPGGGQTSAARLRTILDQQVTGLCCTPTYALHLAEVAAREGISLERSPVRSLIVAGEPGGSIPATRRRIETLWPGATVFDHHGMTEVGPVSYPCPRRPGTLHIIESSYIAEVVDPQTGVAVPPGSAGELVLTTLGRTGSPLLRYRTHDLVHPEPPTLCQCGTPELALPGGILGRTDDMVVVRGVNVYPNTVEEAVRRTGDIAEYQVTVLQSATLPGLRIRLEPEPSQQNPGALGARLQKELQDTLSLRVEVEVVPPGTLPRFELKARRWHRG